MAAKRRLTARPKFQSWLSQLSLAFVALGTALVVTGLAVGLLTFYPVIAQEGRYFVSSFQKPPAVAFSQTADPSALVPVDTNFGIVIAKIRANARVIPNVDPFDSRLYQLALTRGVAHARGTVFPGQTGNIFLFSHSSANFFEASRYNSVFYLLTKLVKDDEIDLFYQGKKFTYRLTDKKIVPAAAIDYLTGQTTNKTLTLMTCWPPGTTLKRLLVFAELKN